MCPDQHSPVLVAAEGSSSRIGTGAGGETPDISLWNAQPGWNCCLHSTPELLGQRDRGWGRHCCSLSCTSGRGSSSSKCCVRNGDGTLSLQCPAECPEQTPKGSAPPETQTWQLGEVLNCSRLEAGVGVCEFVRSFPKESSMV